MTDKQRLALVRKIEARMEMTGEGWRQAKDDLDNHGHWKAIRQMVNALEADLEPDAPVPPKVPALGPIEVGGKSLLQHSLTHATSGLPLYPALDAVWDAGDRVLAPEAGKITRHSGNSNGGYSVYMTGKSGLEYYCTHLTFAKRAPLGAIKKGATLGIVGDPRNFPAQNVEHAHLGINAEKYLGKGKQLKYGRTGKGPDYTKGSPIIGVQLAKVT